MNKKKQCVTERDPIAIYKIPTFQFYAPKDIVGIPNVFVRVEYSAVPNIPGHVAYEAYAQVGQHDELSELACWGTIPSKDDEIALVEAITNCIIHNVDFVQTVRRIKRDNDRYDREIKKQARRHAVRYATSSEFADDYLRRVETMITQEENNE
jgi:hypothetical protein